MLLTLPVIMPPPKNIPIPTYRPTPPEHSLIEGKSGTEVIEFVQMANVRSEPYIDETKQGCVDETKEGHFVTADQRMRFFSISYYKG